MKYFTYSLLITLLLTTNSLVAQPTLYQKATVDYLTGLEKINNNRFVRVMDKTLLCVDSLGKIVWAKKYKNQNTGSYKSFREEIRYFSKNYLVAINYDLSSSVNSIAKSVCGISKLDTSGNLIWETQLEIDSSKRLYTIKSLDQDTDENIYAVGQITDSNTRNYKSLLIKIDKNGKEIWRKQFADSYSNPKSSAFGQIKYVSTNHLIVVNKHSILKLDLDGNIIWSKNYTKNGASTQMSFRQLVVLPNYDMIVNGYTSLTKSTLFRIDANGSVIWAENQEPFHNYNYYHYGIALSPDKKRFYTTGMYTNPNDPNYSWLEDATLNTFNVDGNWVWSKAYSSTSCNSSRLQLPVVFGRDSTMYLSGLSQSYQTQVHRDSLSSYDGYSLRVDSLGSSSCFDKNITLEFTPTTLSVGDEIHTISQLNSKTQYVFSNDEDVEIVDSIICISTNPVGVRFEANDSTLCVGQCIDFSSEATVLTRSVSPYIYDQTKSPYPDIHESYKWSFPGATVTAGSDKLKNPTAVCYSDTGKFDVSLTIYHDCDSFKITRPNYIIVGEKVSTIDVTSSKSTICLGDSAKLTASGASAYKWTPKSSLSDSVGSSVFAKPTQTTTYTVIGGEEGCSATKEITLNVNPTQVTANAGIDTAICSGESVMLKGIETGSTSFQWDNGQLTKNITVTPINTTDYVFTAINGNCESKDTVKVTVKPTPSFSLPAEIAIEPLESTTLVASGGGTYVWSPATGLSCADCASPTASPTQTTEYCVVVTNTEGCEAKQCTKVKLTIHCGELFIPTGFSPNGDNINDKLEVKVNAECVSDYSFMIFDRWGEKLFSSTKITDSWDGKFNGKELDNGVFVYTLKIRLVDSSEFLVKKGNISIIK